MLRAEHRLLFLAFLLAVPLPASGAETKKAPGRFKIGPVFLTPRFFIRSAGIDTNVYNASSNEVSDTSVVMSPALDVALPIGQRLRLLADGGLNFNYFHKQRTERSTDYYGNGRLELDVGPFTFFGGGGGGRHKQRFSIEVDERVWRTEPSYSAGATVRVTRKLDFGVAGRRQTSTYDSGTLVDGYDVKESLDRRSTTGSFRANYALTDQTTLTGFAEIREDRFTSQRGQGPNVARAYLYAGGFRFGERAFINGSIVAGIRQFPTLTDQAAPTFSGLYLNADASVPFFRFGRLGGTAYRDVFYAVTQAPSAGGTLRNSYVSTQFGINLAVELPFNLIGRCRAGLERSVYLLPYLQDGAPFDRVDRVRTAGGGLLRAFGKAIRIGADAQWSRRTSNFEGFDYTGWRYGLTAEVTP